jgi:hypothetical protein
MDLEIGADQHSESWRYLRCMTMPSRNKPRGCPSVLDEVILNRMRIYMYASLCIAARAVSPSLAKGAK